MFIRPFISSVLIVTSSFILAFGQDAPEVKKEKEKKIVKSFAFSFDGDGGYLGVQTQEVSRENFAKFGLREVRGVAVEKVMENSPASVAGIQSNDVIVRFNGDEVTSTRKLTRLISEVAPDHKVSLTVLRNGHEKDMNATLGKRPMPRFENGNFSGEMPGMIEKELEIELPDMKDMPKGEGMRIFTIPPGGEGKSFTWKSGESRQIGILIHPLTKQMSENGVDSGVRISNIREGSPAFKAGLKVGDIIVEVDGKTINTHMDMVRALNEKKEGDVQLTIVRDRNRQTISVTPEASKNGGFIFQTDDDDEGMMPPQMPAKIRITKPIGPAAPMVAPGRAI